MGGELNPFEQDFEQEVSEVTGGAISPEEASGICLSKIEAEIERHVGKPITPDTEPKDSRYHSPLLDSSRPPTRKELERRSEIEYAFLDLERNATTLRLRYRFEDSYDALQNIAETGREYIDETARFAYNIAKALDPR